ncbi:MAG: response regulator [Alphaproteobacteria bacterium]|nr:response regulator [Alphaproteobacteria bacterium]
MFLIDSKAEYHLTAMLETWRTNAEEGWRVMILNRSTRQSLQNLSPTFICTVAQKYLNDPDAKAFVCVDGDMVMVSKHWRYEHQQKIMIALSALAEESLSECARLYDATVEAAIIRQFVAQKVEFIETLRREAEMFKISEQERAKQQAAATHRKEILDMRFDETLLRTISHRRAAREHVEILIVEDDKFSQQMVQAALRKQFSISFAENGEQALLMYVQNPPDIMFLDINLPDIEGFDVLKKLRQMDEAGFIVMLSGNGDRDNVVRAIEQGAKGFVGKPFSPKKLTDYIFKSPWVQRLIPAETVS